MATTKDILGAYHFNKIIEENQLLGKSDSEITSILKQTALEQFNKKDTQSPSTFIPKEQEYYQQKDKELSGDSFLDGVFRGTTEAAARGIAFANYVDDAIGTDLIGDEFAQKNAIVLDTLEQRKQNDSRKELSQERKDELATLDKENRDATGTLDTLVAGGKTLLDTVTHPSEWTTQGIVAGIMPTDPANAVDIVTGGIGGKVVRKLGGGLLPQIAVGAGSGALSGGGVEYGVAKGSFKSDEEASKNALIGGAFGAALGGGTALIGGVLEKRKNDLNNQNIPNEEVEKNTIDLLKRATNFYPIVEVNNDIKNNPLIKEVVAKEVQQDIKDIAVVEQISSDNHNKTKELMTRAMQEGKTLDELYDITKNELNADQKELTITKLINNDMEVEDPRLVGFRIVNVLEDTIKNNPNADVKVLKKKLTSAYVDTELADAFIKSYEDGNTRALVNFISDKIDGHLQPKYESIANDTVKVVENYNLQLQADEVNWQNSVSKNELDGFVKEIANGEFIAPEEMNTLYELNKLGFVDELTHESVQTKTGRDASGAYDIDRGKIAIDNETSDPITKVQTLQHEYVHSATIKLMENDKEFFNNINAVMDDAKNLSDAKDSYGFSSPFEFVAEAYSNPEFAIKLNDTKISNSLREKLNIPDSVVSVWDFVMDSFVKSVEFATGKKIDLNKESHFATLNKIMAKKIQEFEDIKTQRINDGTSLEKNLKEPKNIQINDIDILKNHPRFDELMDMRKDVKATDIRYDKKVNNRGTVIVDNERLGGEDRTKRIPTSYEKNWNADFVLTKRDIKDIKKGKITPELIEKIKQDLNTLDNHQDWKYPDDADVRATIEQLGKEANSNFYVNKDGEIIKDGDYLFSFVGAKDNEIGAFSDIETRKVMKELDDSLGLNHLNLPNKRFENISNSTNFKKDPLKITKIVSKYELNKLKNKYSDLNYSHYGLDQYEVSFNIDIDNTAPLDMFFYNGVPSYLKNLYPEIGDIKIADISKKAELGAYYPENNTIYLNFDKQMGNEKKLYSSLLHEIQHYIQNKEKWDGGTNPEKAGSAKAYWESWGERQARATQRRSDYTAEQRTKEDWNKTLTKNEKDNKYLFKQKEVDSIVSIEDIQNISSSKFSKNKASPEKSYHPLKRTMKIGDGDAIVGVQKENNNILVGRDKNGEHFTISKENAIKQIKKSNENYLFKQKEVEKNTKTTLEKIDQKLDDTVQFLDNSFKGLDKNGKIKPNTWKLMDLFRKALVPDSFKAKEFVQFVQQNKREKQRTKVFARALQEDLNTLNKEDSSLLVLALDGDIPKAELKEKLGDSLYNTYTILRDTIDQNRDDLIEAGLLDASVTKEDYVKRFYEEHLKNKGIFNGLFGSGYKQDRQFTRKNLSKKQRDNIGQIRDAGYVVARTILEQENQLRKGKFLSTVADEFAVDTPKDGFVQIPDEKVGSINKYGKLNGKYVPKAVFDEIKGVVKMQGHTDNVIIDGAKDFGRWLKGTWTAGNPSTHLYNVISNNLNLFLNGKLFTVKNGRTFGGSRGVAGIKKFLNKDTKEAYKQELTNAGLYDDSFFDMLDARVGEMSEQELKPKTLFKNIINGAFFKKDSTYTQKMEHIYDMEDKVFRVFVYEEEKWDLKVAKYEKEFGKVKKWDKKTKDTIEAIELDQKELETAMNEARDMFVDYSKEVPQWLATLDNYMVAPFARYTYLATIRQTKVAIKHPVRALAVGLFLEDAIQGIFGEDEELDSSDPLKPDWMKTDYTNFNMYGANNFIKIDDNKDDSTWLNMGRSLPGFRMFGVTAGFYAELANMVKDQTDKYGNPVYKKSDDLPVKTAKTLSKLSEMVLPPMFPVALPVYRGEAFTNGGNFKKDNDGNILIEGASIGGRYAQKVSHAILKTKLDRYGNPIKTEDIMKQILGIKLERVDKVQEATKALKKLVEEEKPQITKATNQGNTKKANELQKVYDEKVKDIRKRVQFKIDLPNSKNKNNFDIRMPKFDLDF